MKKTLMVTIVTLLLLHLFAENIVDLWKRVSYHSRRVLIETGISSRVRLEEIYKWMGNKLVFVLAPSNVIWFRTNGKCYLGEAYNLRRSPLEILDLEDLALRDIEKAKYTVVNKGEYYEISFEKNGKYLIFLDKTGIPIKIKRDYMGTVSELIFEYREPIDKPPDEILSKLSLDESEIYLPKPLMVLLQNFRFFRIQNYKGNMEIYGIMKNGAKVRICFGTTPPSTGTLTIELNNMKLFSVTDEKTMETIKEIIHK